jgi:NADH-quinone oxidoreductase subunit H
MFFFSEYVAIVASSGLMVALFFGGWHVPFLDREGLNVVIGDQVVARAPLAHGVVVLVGVLAFVVKTVVLCWLQLAVRWTLPRFRYDQLMGLGWRRLLPASLGNIAVTAVVLLAIDGASQTVTRGLDAVGDLAEVVVGVIGIGLIGWLVVYLLRPAVHTKLEVTSSARFTRAAGGTRTARMGA